MSMNETAVQAVELEAFVEDIPDLQAHFDKLQTRLEKGGHKLQISQLHHCWRDGPRSDACSFPGAGRSRSAAVRR